ncbi:hypothetical protein OH76DRAFT_642099 [Lentinus brumalis]|uniref:Uncharacterized protein n=1 Tax=Lentinus brumalis TaxID=2498619 RepID=A0A371D7T4_9APHY|nr:hypothetical protein OH76DRAFT_642099 [Polyporus brumalis]
MGLVDSFSAHPPLRFGLHLEVILGRSRAHGQWSLHHPLDAHHYDLLLCTICYLSVALPRKCVAFFPVPLSILVYSALVRLSTPMSWRFYGWTTSKFRRTPNTPGEGLDKYRWTLNVVPGGWVIVFYPLIHPEHTEPANCSRCERRKHDSDTVLRRGMS